MSNAKRSPSMQEGMMNVLGLATNVGGRVADVAVNAPVAPIKPSPSDEEVSKNVCLCFVFPQNCFLLAIKT